MRFAYYKNLSPADQRTYRKSDAITAVELPRQARRRIRTAVASLEAALKAESPQQVRRATERVCDGITGALGVAPVRVRVKARRPRERDGGELYGQYFWEEDTDGSTEPVLEVWMRTTAQRRVVAFRTFLRTVLHELCHHLDYVLYKLPETFHTEGFFRRESSLFKQIGGESPGRQRTRAASSTKPRSSLRPGPADRSPGGTTPGDRGQLELPLS